MQIKPIEINGKKFESRKAACEYFKISGFKLQCLVKKYGCTIPEAAFKNQRSKNFINLQKKKKDLSYCKVKCIEDNIIYSSIAAAARSCNVNDWTMSVKMQAAGKFEKDGKTYIRLSPMKSKNVYNNTGTTIQTDYAGRLRTRKKKEESITTVSSITSTMSSMDMARNIIKAELINRINQNNWQEAGALLEVITKLQ